MAKIIISVLLAALFTLIQGCGYPADASPLPSSPATVLHQAYNNDYAIDTNKSAVVFRNQDEYEKELAFRTNAPPASINFETSVVLMLDMGTRSSSGYSIHLKSIREDEHYMIATIELLLPGNCPEDTALTNPYQFIAIESKKDILITEELVSRTCSQF